MLPIVLAHGYWGFSRIGGASYFRDIEQLLHNLGIAEVFATTVDPRGSLRERAGQLIAQISHQFPGRKVHVIAHSMGGLDARFAVSAKGLARRDLIETLTTLGSPFAGTAVADLAAANFDNPAHVHADILLQVARELLAMAPKIPLAPAETHVQFKFAVARLLEFALSAVRGDYSGLAAYIRAMLTLSDEALHELTRENCRAIFSADQSDVAGLPMFSYAGVTSWPSISAPLILSQLIIGVVEGPENDGLVALNSATLRQTHMANIPTDHFGLIGWSAFDVSPWYRKIVDTIRSHDPG